MNRFIYQLIPILAILVFYVGFSYSEETNKTSQSSLPDSTKINKTLVVKLPKLIDLGSKSCIPCKKMAPILDSLREAYKGRAEIVFIDTRENRQAALDHKITLIPTQIFFDTLGVEKFRHVGFFPADSIVAHLRAIGVKYSGVDF